jgi:AraC-like DNA-binding protein
MEAGQRRDLIEHAMESTSISQIYWVTEMAHPGKGGTASLGGDYMRLVLILQGRRHVRIVHEGQPRSLALAAGESIIVGPRAWLVTEPTEPFLSIGAVLEARNPRFVLARQEFRDRTGRSIAPRAEVEFAPGLCDDTTMLLAGALLGTRAPAAADLYHRRLAETLFLRLARFQPATGGAGPGKANVTYGAAEHFVRENFSRPIDRRQVARHLRISPSHVTRLFLTFSGESFGGFLLRVRLESARTLLRDLRLTFSDVAYLAGFTSANYFVRAYRRRYGVTPGRNRNVAGEAGASIRPAR